MMQRYWRSILGITLCLNISNVYASDIFRDPSQQDEEVLRSKFVKILFKKALSSIADLRRTHTALREIQASHPSYF